MHFYYFLTFPLFAAYTSSLPAFGDASPATPAIHLPYPDSLLRIINSTVSLPDQTNLTSNEIECYAPSQFVTSWETTFAACRSVWQGVIRRLPKFYEVQEFVENERPEIPAPQPQTGKPPFTFIAFGGPRENNCAIVVDADNSQRPDRFSWAQVKDSAQQIMDPDAGCGSPSYGGRKAIGVDGIWRVRVYGYPKGRPPLRTNGGTEGTFTIGNHTLIGRPVWLSSTQ